MSGLLLISVLTYEYPGVTGAGPVLGVTLQAGGIPDLNVMGKLLYPRVLG